MKFCGPTYGVCFGAGALSSGTNDGAGNCVFLVACTGLEFCLGLSDGENRPFSLLSLPTGVSSCIGWGILTSGCRSDKTLVMGIGGMVNAFPGVALVILGLFEERSRGPWSSAGRFERSVELDSDTSGNSIPRPFFSVQLSIVHSCISLGSAALYFDSRRSILVRSRGTNLIFAVNG